MNFYEAITKLNVLSSYDTTKEKREQFKECINVILKEKENYDRVMCEPIQQIMKNLQILEEIRAYVKVIDYGGKYQNRYALQVENIIIPELKKEIYDKWNRWLENDK